MENIYFHSEVHWITLYTMLSMDNKEGRVSSKAQSHLSSYERGTLSPHEKGTLCSHEEGTLCSHEEETLCSHEQGTLIKSVVGERKRAENNHKINTVTKQDCHCKYWRLSCTDKRRENLEIFYYFHILSSQVPLLQYKSERYYLSLSVILLPWELLERVKDGRSTPRKKNPEEGTRRLLVARFLSPPAFWHFQQLCHTGLVYYLEQLFGRADRSTEQHGQGAFSTSSA